jgi:serine/threonine-protein kinase
MNHPNVIGVHEVGEENGIYYLSMEYVGGGSVQDLLTGAKKLDPLRATELVVQAARALEYAEKAGIVHRDVKPDNLMLTETGDVRLADLGIAKRLNPDGKADQAEGVFGSPHYMAPEQARGFNLDHRADLYSLGVTYYRMLSGKLPFTGKDAREIMEKQVFENAEPLKRVEPHLAPIVYRIVERLMRKRPEQRYASATELLPDLETALQQIRAGVRDDGLSASRSSGSRSRLAVRTAPAKRKGFFRRFFS